MAVSRVIAIGGSAGSLEPLQTVVSKLPRDLRAAVLVVIHIPANHQSHLAHMLSRVSRMNVAEVANGMELQEKTVYVACPDRHTLVQRDHIHLSSGPKENHSRPAINPLFRSAAIAYGSAVIGVVLSGALDDGTAGLWEIKRNGGIAVIQSPEDSSFPDMPTSALRHVKIDYVRPAEKMGALLSRLVSRKTSMRTKRKASPSRGHPTGITCPECRGAIEQFSEGGLVEFRCRVKHTYSPETMLTAHEEARERALWASIVALREGVELVGCLKNKVPKDRYTVLKTQADRNRVLAEQIEEFLVKRGA
jgi:two-component system chemotaxis response regulator CheB